MHREYRRRHSPGLNRETELLVVGHAGAPVLVFPTSKGKFYEWEDRGMLELLRRQVENGWLQFYCVDSVDAESWYCRRAHPGARAYRRYAPLHAGRLSPAGGGSRRPLPVPSTSVYSRSDGIVDWRACLQEVGPVSENVAVRGSHLGLGANAAVLWVVADRLAQPVGGWRPFRPPARFGLGSLYPEPDEPVGAARPDDGRRG